MIYYLNKKKRIIMVDLHIHTNASIFDAYSSPEDVVSIALLNGVRSIAITDHSTVKAITPAMKAGEKMGVEVIPGVEIAATYNEAAIHIIGLFIDHLDPSLVEFLSGLEAMHGINNQLMVGVLVGMGFPLTMDQISYLVEINSGSRVYLIQYLEKQGIINANDLNIKQEIMDKLMIPNYYKHKRLNADEIIAYIHKANGLAVLAHPLRYNTWDEIDDMLVNLKSCGLDGMEVYYYNHNEEQQKKLLSLAKKYNLLRSGGSDFHGYEKRNGRDIGKGLYGALVPDEALEEMKASVIV
jgi:predicted metal-dependent phosphoesterase TrpH